MSKKGVIKNLIVICFALILSGSFSFVFLSAHEMDKKTDKEDVKSASVKSISGDHQDKKEASEDIKPPEGEQWYEPGDEEIYTLKLNIEKPKEGITGGRLVYCGVYIEPPYKVELRGTSIFVNGININSIPKELLAKIEQRKRLKKKQDYPPLDKDELIKDKYQDEVLEAIKKKQFEIFNKYDKDYENNAEKVDKEFKEYLLSNPKIIIRKYYDFRNVYIEFRLNNELFGYYALRFEGLSPKQFQERQAFWAEQVQRSYNDCINSLSNSIVLSDHGSASYFANDSLLKKICNILEQPDSRENKITKLYDQLKILSIHPAKLYYYNFDPVKFGCVEYFNEK